MIASEAALGSGIDPSTNGEKLSTRTVIVLAKRSCESFSAASQAPSTKWKVSRSASAMISQPFAGEWRGHGGLAEYFRLFFSILTPSPEGFLRNVRYLSNGGVVVCWMEAYARVAGVPGPEPAVWVNHRYEVDGGKIARYENHFDTQVGAEHLAEARAKNLLGA